MHIVRWGVPATSLLLAFDLILLTSSLSAQIIAQTLVPPKIIPASAAIPTALAGAYWRLQLPNQPPLPYNPFPDLPVYTVDPTNHVYVIDDSTVDYPAFYESRAMADALMEFAGEFALQSEEGGEGGSAMFPLLHSSDDLWLEMTGLSLSDRTGHFVIHPPQSETNGVYDLFATTNLISSGPGLNGTNWQWVLRCDPGQTNLVVTSLLATECYFRLARTNDTDGDLLSDAFEWLVSHTDSHNGDQNSNGIPDSWEWNHFGNLAQTAEGDYDGDLVNNYDEWLAGSDPNSVMFSIVATNQYVKTDVVPVQLNVTGGVPSSQAVLLDSTNFAAATWTPYTSSNLTVTLPNPEGWHDVWIGLRGRLATSEQTWQWRRLKLDRTPPLLIVTDPPSTVSQPMIQLLGYSPESLSVISCELSNAAGVFGDRMILVLDHFYDTNTFEFTTNTFQGFDLSLKTGLNTITIHALDLAGNLTTTNFNFTLASDSTAPVIQLWWPQEGAQLIGDTFTWRGLVDDFTAKLTAQILDASGNTNVQTALVERDGKFWFENLPLADGTNILALTAVDYWGNLTTTNINVMKSSMNLTIDSLDENALNEATINVSGTIDVNDHTVWVNGVKATLNGDGTWTAQDVPVNPGGTAVIQARAIPNSDNGGYGTGGSGGASATGQNPGNPASPLQSDKGSESDKHWQLYIYKDDVNFQNSHRKIRYDFYSDPGLSNPTGWSTGEYWDNYEQHWTHDPQKSEKGFGKGTMYHKEHDERSDNTQATYGPCTSTFVWPVTGAQNLAYVSSCGGSNYWIAAPPVISEHCEVNDPPLISTDSQNTTDYPYSRVHWDYVPYTRSAQTKWRLFTGGKETPARDALWRMSGTAFEIVNKRMVRPFDAQFTRQIDNSQIKIFDKTLESDGTIFKTLPNGKHVDVPFEAGIDFYTFMPTATPFYLISRCVCPRKDLDRTTVGVGEEVDLYWSSAPPAGVTIAWTTSAGGVVPTNTWPTRFTAPSNASSATVTATVRDEKCTINFDVKEPTGVDHAVFGNNSQTSSSGLYPYDFGKAGAGMHIKPYLNPTNVSFYRVEIMEVGEDANSVTGYFTNFTVQFLSHKSHGADQWLGINCDNTWKENWDDAKSAQFNPPWSGGGSFRWNIPWKWKIGAATVHSMGDGWTQDFSMNANGTFTVTKFDRSVERPTDQQYGTPH